ncbi:conserved hypothetical protein [Histoplasma capsulatum G186AR]|uniref:CREG-like beta-barrel domain-containing protein n=2 Tax=Ajellomyces capsulatus TaxID=5037 RepID=C0NRG1_AJECG|nr:uncharacterized protein HCBG_05591 [Histoplasma capsulatum G186AR]EEH06275.1 conserved hypothetical protein [Histoplasma capsulatum G186AR]KAG5293269.1 hypothetical protein I7I52_04535 [Histoplasma capsulatum]QSS74720.1 hypothetical protein I7I50_03628 [Histoplasma capsulatum G186AR]
MWSLNILAFMKLLLFSLAATLPPSTGFDAIGRASQFPITPIEKAEPPNLQEVATGRSHTASLGNEDDPINKPEYTFPSWDTTHLLARRLLALSTTGVLSTVYPPSSSVHRTSLSGVPIGLPDYIADCANEPSSELEALLGPGNPLILALNIGTTFRNTKAGSNISLSVDWWHRQADGRTGVFGVGRDGVVGGAELPRLSLLGSLVPLEHLSDATRIAVERCFLDAHPDAKFWLPDHDNAVHSGYWAKLVVEEAFWVGGFGDRARIGWLDPETWKLVRRDGNSGNRGWADVRLPGE